MYFTQLTKNIFSLKYFYLNVKDSLPKDGNISVPKKKKAILSLGIPSFDSYEIFVSHLKAKTSII